MFERLDPSGGRPVVFSFDGARVTGRQGESLAAALLAEGFAVLRHTPVSAQPRGAFCMMGACFECLVEIDGRTVQACMVAVRDGLVVNRLGPLADRAPGDNS